MCSDNPNLPKEANKAKCFVVSCFVLCAAELRRAHTAAPYTRSPSILRLCGEKVFICVHCTVDM